jgi:hypothetical protein
MNIISLGSISPVRLSATRQTSPRPKPNLSVHKRGSTLELTSELLASAAEAATRRELLDRLFSISALHGARVNSRRGSALLDFKPNQPTVAESLEALTSAMRLRQPERLPFPNEHLLFTVAFDGVFEVRRAERKLTLWQIDEVSPERFVAVHPLLRCDAIREQILDTLSCLAGVSHCVAHGVGGVEISCQPHRVNHSILLDVLEPAISDAASHAGRVKSLPALRSTAVTVNLALAPIADFLFPPLGVANVLLVVMLSARHLLPAYRTLSNRRVNLDTLYICIGVVTVLSYTFVAMAVMIWLLEFWPRLLKRFRRESERKLLALYRRRPRKVWLDRDGTTVEADLYELPSGQTVILREGDTVPADGTVIDGIAEIRESWLTGAPGLVRKEPGDKLYAASQVTHGEVNFRIESAPGHTVADRLAAYYKQAFNQPRKYPSAERFADGFVLPALVIGTAALGRGGLVMTQAVIRPDYVTGPTIAEEVGALTTMIQAAEAGILISNPSVLETLIDADCWVFDDSVSWRFHGAGNEKFGETLNDRGRRDMVYLSGASQGDAARIAGKFGFSWFRGECTTTAKKDFIAQKQYDGQSVVYFGNCVREAEAAEKADLAVNVGEGESGAQANAPILFLNPDLAKCWLLLSLSVARMIGLRSTQATVTVPNIAAIVAAIYLNTPVLASVLLTTLGTAISYRHWTRILRSLE